jgi:hypothetical protein
MVSGFRREVYEKYAVLVCYAERSANSLPTFGTNYLFRP